MVSFHTPLSPNGRKIAPRIENCLKKRKLGDDAYVDHQADDQNPILAVTKSSMTMMMKSPKLHTELHLETRIPQEWQRCLDIKSGQIYFYNTRTKQRMLDDPRLCPKEPPPPLPRHGHMSLDLELNLPCGSSSTSSAKNQFVPESTITKHPNNSSGDNHQQQILTSSAAAAAATNDNSNNNITKGLSRAPSWLTFEEGDQEMVAAACRKCHMLVMMCKSSPSCPNCKFLHPPQLSSAPSLLKRRLSLLC